MLVDVAGVLENKYFQVFLWKFGFYLFGFGGLAQLGERLAGSQKVIGSSPLSSIGF